MGVLIDGKTKVSLPGFLRSSGTIHTEFHLSKAGTMKNDALMKMTAAKG